ncbi:MAG: TIGR00282 family metallophosphoesterase [Acidimicrobiia bacterium]|nr:TIGR00282 family metallophosphoesterase [Acidimicrobiia bacterium]
MKVLFVGDIVGRPGRDALKNHLGHILESRHIDLCIANAENAAAGNGITPRLGEELLGLNVDVLTSGNHIFDKKEALPYFEQEPRLLRPANYPPTAPGRGLWVSQTRASVPYAVINLQGRVFMPAIDCPFRSGEALLASLSREIKVILIDFHAEATAEKQALAWHFDGRVSAIIGTHTHVPTADEQVLPGGTAYISDSGMTGPHDSIIGVSKDIILPKFISQMPARFDTATGDVRINAVEIVVSPESGRASSIERFCMKVSDS